jgi:hypothetical protein
MPVAASAAPLKEATVTEELLEFENTVEDEDGLSHVAVVLGEERDDGRWVGRIRFTPTDGSAAVETDRETTQPDRDDLAYWASGLTYFYLEGALVRARRRAEGGSRGGGGALRQAPGTGATGAAGQGSGGGSTGSPAPDSSGSAPPSGARVPRLEVASMDPAIVESVLEIRDPRPGTGVEVPNAGFVVYEGMGGVDGASHMFAVQYGSRNAGAILANWLWSRLHGVGVEVRVNGRVVELTNDALKRAIVD